MKTNYLLPNKYKNLGWVLFIRGVVLGLILQVLEINNQSSFLSFDFIHNFGYDFLDEVISILIITGGLLVGFTKEKIEDEFIYKT